MNQDLISTTANQIQGILRDLLEQDADTTAALGGVLVAAGQALITRSVQDKLFEFEGLKGEVDQLAQKLAEKAEGIGEVEDDGRDCMWRCTFPGKYASSDQPESVRSRQGHYATAPTAFDAAREIGERENEKRVDVQLWKGPDHEAVHSEIAHRFSLLDDDQGLRWIRVDLGS